MEVDLGRTAVTDASVETLSQFKAITLILPYKSMLHASTWIPQVKSAALQYWQSRSYKFK